jgi:hypothetical protein
MTMIAAIHARKSDDRRHLRAQEYPMTRDTLFATFSTVAQTLAAVLAILIAIVVIRLPTIEGTIFQADTLLRAFEPYKSDYPKARAAFEKSGARGVSEAGFKIDLQDPNTAMRLDDGYRALQTRKRLVPLVWSALIPTFLDIAVCLAALSAVSYLTARPRLARTATATVVLLAVLCLGTYVFLMKRLLDAGPG